MTAKLQTTPAKLDWEMYAGDTVSEQFTLIADSAPVDLTGTTITAHARATVRDTDPALVATCQVSDPTNGVFTVSWDGTDLQDIVLGLASGDRWQGVWDLQVSSIGGLRTWLQGRMIVLLDVTR